MMCYMHNLNNYTLHIAHSCVMFGQIVHITHCKINVRFVTCKHRHHSKKQNDIQMKKNKFHNQIIVKELYHN